MQNQFDSVHPRSMTMRQRGYAIVLALVLVAIVLGAFFGGRFVIQRFRQDFQFRRDWSPPEWTPSPAAEAPTITLVPTERPTRTPIVIPTPIAPSPEPYTTDSAPTSPPTEQAAPVQAETEMSTPPTETPTPEPIQVSSEPFQAKGAVRYSQGDCGGTYVLGFVTDRDGVPMAGVRLRLVDEFNNEALAVTKSGQVDLGRYDFPVAGPPRRLSVAVVDDAGTPLSRSAGFPYYGDSPDAQATCYWIDWQRR
jgi:hypothetical protein